MELRSYRRYRRIIAHTGGVSYTPPQVARAYDLPLQYDGKGQTIALVELGGGYRQSDLETYFPTLGQAVPDVQFLSVDGAQNTTTTPDSADGEVALDIDVAGGIAPRAKILVVTGQNTDASFAKCVRAAREVGADVISISWGAPEDRWSIAAVNAMNAEFQACLAAGVVVTAAAGDNGSGDGESGNHVDFPASSPLVLGCGGTSLLRNGNALVETVWNNGSGGGATGGGVSSYFNLPPWQRLSNVPGGGQKRGVPDVAGNADPATGWMIFCDGQQLVIGGTSAVAPMWAGIVAMLNQAAGKRLGLTLLNQLLYGLPADCWKDIQQGNNGTYIARAGYDCCTGLGVPNGSKLFAALASGVHPPPPPPPPTPAPSRIVVSTDLRAGTYSLTPV